ncbi:MAG: hypothetical protein AAB914_01585, partial [Patescibacteria group bacterium]
MTEIQSTVEINGKIYNMKSGQIVDNKIPLHSVNVKSIGKIDGFVGDNSSTAHTISHQHKASKAQINHLARKPAKSKTLVRTVIKRPSTQHVTTTHQVKHSGYVAKVGESTTRSEMIKKFHNSHATPAVAPVKKIHTPVAIKQQKTPSHDAPPLTILQLEDKFRS